MNLTESTIIGELVAENYKTATIFKKHKIDFCCNGNRTIKEACDKKNIESGDLINQLLEVNESASSENTNFNSWELDLLADYIEKKHHRYVKSKIDEIKPFLHKVVKVHANGNPELIEIENLFNQSANELLHHMTKEEMVLFPFIRQMVESKNTHQPMEKPHFQTIENPIAMMKNEHENEGERFAKISELSNNYTPPSYACNTYKVTFALLKEFEDDLHKHIHLENNILFPKACELEKKSF